jgi:hypothetical protein
MSPRRVAPNTSPAVAAGTRRLWAGIGAGLREARLDRGWTVGELARRAEVSAGQVYRIESGLPASTEAAVRLATALGRRLEFAILDARQRPSTAAARMVDPVHSAMGEVEARHLRGLRFGVGIDEPYQHYQFAGRADVVAWDLDRRALLHVENKTRFADLQEVAGSFSAKRAYLADALAERLGTQRWASQTHVMAALWSSEILHVLRLRTEAFRALCPDGPATFEAWWAGTPPRSGITSVLVAFDPAAAGRQRQYVGLEDALTARPRVDGYAEAVRHSTRAGNIRRADHRRH